MTKKQYRVLLKSPLWKKKREKILLRDDNTCQVCGKKRYLQVHHIWYIVDKKPWQVPDSYLITLCRVCHKLAHKGKSIKDFVKT